MSEFDLSTPAGSDIPAAAPDLATQDLAAPQQAIPAAPQDPDRSTWVPPHRLRETREAAIREAQEYWANKEATYQAQLEQVQSQLRALVGVTPQEAPETAAVRQQFSQLYPGLAKLEERANDLLGMTDRSGDMDAQSRHYWQNYGRNAMDRLYSTAEKSLGAPLSQDGKRNLHAAFLGYVSSSPDLTQRYTSDPSIVDEFWTGFSGSLIDPVRRTASATVQQQVAQRNIPQDTPAGVPSPAPPPKLSNIDDRASMGWARYQAEKK